MINMYADASKLAIFKIESLIYCMKMNMPFFSCFFVKQDSIAGGLFLGSLAICLFPFQPTNLKVEVPVCLFSFSANNPKTLHSTPLLALVSSCARLALPRLKMPVRIRLSRFGYKHRPFYRIRVADSRSARDGKFIEHLGTYDPIPDRLNGLKMLRFNVSRMKYWIAMGAQPSESVARLLAQFDLMPLIPKHSTVRIQKDKDTLYPMEMIGPGKTPLGDMNWQKQEQKHSQKIKKQLKQLHQLREEMHEKQEDWVDEQMKPLRQKVKQHAQWEREREKKILKKLQQTQKDRTQRAQQFQDPNNPVHEQLRKLSEMSDTEFEHAMQTEETETALRNQTYSQFDEKFTPEELLKIFQLEDDDELFKQQPELFMYIHEELPARYGDFETSERDPIEPLPEFDKSLLDEEPILFTKSDVEAANISAFSEEALKEPPDVDEWMQAVREATDVWGPVDEPVVPLRKRIPEFKELADEEVAERETAEKDEKKE